MIRIPINRITGGISAIENNMAGAIPRAPILGIRDIFAYAKNLFMDVWLSKNILGFFSFLCILISKIPREE